MSDPGESVVSTASTPIVTDEDQVDKAFSASENTPENVIQSESSEEKLVASDSPHESSNIKCDVAADNKTLDNIPKKHITETKELSDSDELNLNSPEPREQSSLGDEAIKEVSPADKPAVAESNDSLLDDSCLDEEDDENLKEGDNTNEVDHSTEGSSDQTLSDIPGEKTDEQTKMKQAAEDHTEQMSDTEAVNEQTIFGQQKDEGYQDIGDEKEPINKADMSEMEHKVTTQKPTCLSIGQMANDDGKSQDVDLKEAQSSDDITSRLEENIVSANKPPAFSSEQGRADENMDSTENCGSAAEGGDSDSTSGQTTGIFGGKAMDVQEEEEAMEVGDERETIDTFKVVDTSEQCDPKDTELKVSGDESGKTVKQPASDTAGMEAISRVNETANDECDKSKITDITTGVCDGDGAVESIKLNETAIVDNKDSNKSGVVVGEDTEMTHVDTQGSKGHSEEASKSSGKDKKEPESSDSKDESKELKDTVDNETNAGDVEMTSLAEGDNACQQTGQQDMDADDDFLETPISCTVSEKDATNAKEAESADDIIAAIDNLDGTTKDSGASAKNDVAVDSGSTSTAGLNTSSNILNKDKEKQQPSTQLPVQKIKQEPKDTSESMQGVAADVVNEYLGIMGMDKLETEEQNKLQVAPKFTGAMKKEVTSSGKEKEKPKGGESPQKKQQKCIVCQKVQKCKYNIVRNGDIKHLCDDVCFKKFRINPVEYLKDLSKTAAPPLSSAVTKPTTSLKTSKDTSVATKGVECCECKKKSDLKITWHGLDFCSESCLYQRELSLGKTCAFCMQMIATSSLSKYCTNSGSGIKQFCRSACLEEFKKRVKLCSSCNRDLSTLDHDSFMAPVSKTGEFRDFCTEVCMTKYLDNSKNTSETTVDIASPGRRTRLQATVASCASCGRAVPTIHQVLVNGSVHKICSQGCLNKFKVDHSLSELKPCESCGVLHAATHCHNTLNFQGASHYFCTPTCLNVYKGNHTKVVTCLWCKMKKVNFDMVQQMGPNNSLQYFCTLKCLSMQRVKTQATSNQPISCDHCHKVTPPQYHLTMSDASVRNFCCYSCVMTFQSQFQTGPRKTSLPPPPPYKPPMTRPAHTPAPAPAPAQVHPYRTMPTLQRMPQQASQPVVPVQPPQASLPQIANVMSLAPAPSQTARQKSTETTKSSPKTPKVSMPQTIVQKEVIIQYPPPKHVKNKSLLCKPYSQTKATSCRPHSQAKETQTDGEPEKMPVVIPVPVPIYIPVPMAMYSLPTPFPFPVPIPVPIPCFIPTTKKSTTSILKHIKEIQERLPSDPLEAELLMMAEAVACSEKVTAESSDESDKEDVPESGLDSYQETPTALNTDSNTFGEDIMQMALQMAEMTEPVMDLEDSLAPVPVNQTQGDFSTIDSESGIFTTGAAKRGRKRQSRSSKRNVGKRPRTASPTPVAPPVQVVPSPDADMHLKYMYGVNAWKHWVAQKNQQLAEKSDGRGRTKKFKTDILACTADELNYSLCLFVQEVRKPNGSEYAADSIYYLCLGIQQYLFENGRIDNIFTDFYYEKFTGCLNKVIGLYEARLNGEGILVCRIEEEHLWESKQLGAHSPHVLLNTLVYFNTRYFFLRSPEAHLKLSFSHIMKQWKKTAVTSSKNHSRSVYLRYYNPAMTDLKKSRGRREPDESNGLEQCENLENPLRCPVKLYEFYLSKCPESIKNRSDVFYLIPERSCVPDSPVWYSTQALGLEATTKMMNRVRTVREIQESFLLHPSPTD